MNSRKSISILLLLFAMATLAWAQDQKALTNKDVMDMVKKGLNESVIIKVIQASDTNFDTSPDAMTQMQSGGATVKVMGAMLKAQSSKKKAEAAAPQSPVSPAPASAATPDPNAGKYLLKEGTQVPLKFAGDVSSRYATPGDKVELTLVTDIKVGDVVVVKQGAKAFVVVTNAKKAGMLPGSVGELSLHMEHMTSGETRIRLRGSKGPVLGAIGQMKHGNVEVDEGTPLMAYVDEEVWLSPAK
jgi:biotin carboxyl carrier protein